MGDRVFLAIPSRGSLQLGTFEATHNHGCPDLYTIRARSGSLLCLVFNALWADALNERDKFRYFVMLHDDVVPAEPRWLQVLVDSYKEAKTDILSCVIPIKDSRGLSSTAFLNPQTGEMRRLTMREAFSNGEEQKTFGGEILGLPDWKVLPNTGLWICDFQSPWVQNFCFNILDRIVYNQEAKLFEPQALGEDWGLGMWAARHGLTVKATTKIRLYHEGGFKYPAAPWGEWPQDQEIGIAFEPVRQMEGWLKSGEQYEARDSQ